MTQKVSPLCIKTTNTLLDKNKLTFQKLLPRPTNLMVSPSLSSDSSNTGDFLVDHFQSGWIDTWNGRFKNIEAQNTSTSAKINQMINHIFKSEFRWE